MKLIVLFLFSCAIIVTLSSSSSVASEEVKQVIKRQLLGGLKGTKPANSRIKLIIKKVINNFRHFFIGIYYNLKKKLGPKINQNLMKHHHKRARMLKAINFREQLVAGDSLSPML